MEFPGGPVVRTPSFHCQGPGFNPGQGTKIPQATWHSQKEKTNIKSSNKRKSDKFGYIKIKSSLATRGYTSEQP